MAKLLYIEASPRKERSASIEVAKVFLDAYQGAHPGDQVETVNLWNLKLPEFNDGALNAKYAIMHGQPHTPEQRAAWNEVVKVAEHFKSADKFLFSLPMWNFGVPYKLKHFIDVLTQPGLTFSFTPEEGYKGLVLGKPAAVIYARGGEYPAGTGYEAYDLQKKYMDLWLGFIGITDVKSILVEPTLSAPEAVSKAMNGARDQAKKVASGL